MKYFNKIKEFIIPYKGYIALNFLCNIFYAVFSTLSLIISIPLFDVLFKTTKRVYKKPNFNELSLKSYLENSLNYFVTQQIDNTDS